MRRSFRTQNRYQQSRPLATIIIRPAIAVTPSPVMAVNSPKTFYQQWRRLSWKYKAAAATAITIGLVAIIFGCIFPPVIIVTIPLLKISCSTLLIISGSILAVLTAIGHVCHIFHRTQSPDENMLRQIAPIQETLTHSPNHANTNEIANEATLSFYDESIINYSHEQRNLQPCNSAGTILEMLQFKNQPILSRGNTVAEESRIVDHTPTLVGSSDPTPHDCTATTLSIQNLSSR